jgi:Mg2+ and Co2+ transporter CorA
MSTTFAPSIEDLASEIHALDDAIYTANFSREDLRRQATCRALEVEDITGDFHAGLVTLGDVMLAMSQAAGASVAWIEADAKMQADIVRLAWLREAHDLACKVAG